MHPNSLQDINSNAYESPDYQSSGDFFQSDMKSNPGGFVKFPRFPQTMNNSPPAFSPHMYSPPQLYSPDLSIHSPPCFG